MSDVLADRLCDAELALEDALALDPVETVEKDILKALELITPIRLKLDSCSIGPLIVSFERH